MLIPRSKGLYRSERSVAAPELRYPEVVLKPRVARIFVAIWCFAWIAAVASCRDLETHEVTVGFTFLDGGTVRGFGCADAVVQDAIARAASKKKLSLVVDLFRAPGQTRCRYVEILDACRGRGCPIVASARKCFPLDVRFDVPVGERSAEIGRALSQLKGQILTKDVPSDPVIVRAAALAGSCEEILASPDPNVSGVVGCATSCPLVLQNADLDVRLDYDGREGKNSNCGQNLKACAAVDFSETFAEGGAP